MGLAAGSKYNAMLAWFFVNLIMIFCYSRDTGEGLPALKFGAVFFALALLIVLPWYIKNYILTANPAYPLFDGFFKHIHHAGSGGDGLAWVSQNNWGQIFFREGR